MGEPDAESGPYNLCKYKHFAPHAHAILRFFRAHKPTMALLSPAEPLSHSALCFYRGKIPWRFISMPSIAFPVGRSMPFAPSDRVLAPYGGSSSQRQSLSRFAPKCSAFAFPAKRGEFGLKNGEENRKNSRFFGASSPVFPIATPPLLSRRPPFRPAPPTVRIDVVAKLCSPLRIEQLPGRFALDTRRTRIIRGHIDRLLRRRETKTPPVYENRPRAGIGMCRPRSRNCRATAQRLPLRLPKSPVNPRRRRKSL